MGLKTKMTSSVAYDHGNALAENAVARVRALACSLMHQLHGRLGITLSTNSAMWSWALVTALAYSAGFLSSMVPLLLSLHMDDNSLALCASMVNLCMDSSTLAPRKQQPNGEEPSFWASQKIRTALCFLMERPLSSARMCAGSQPPGAVIWPSTSTTNAIPGSIDLALEPESFQP